MARFFYKARQGTGALLEGEVDAAHARGAFEQIVHKGLTPVEIAEAVVAGGTEAAAPAGRKPPSVWPRVKAAAGQRRRCPDAARLAVVQSLSDLTESQVPLLEALELTARQTPHPAAKENLRGLIHQVRDGVSFADAAAGCPALFDRFMARLLRAGEEGGFLNRALRYLHEHLEARAELRSQVVSAMVYPAVIVVAGVVTLAVLLIGVLPKITLVFADLDMALPLPTKVLLALSDGAARWGWLGLIGITGAGWILYRWWKTPPGRQRLDRWRLRVPLLGRMAFTAEMIALGQTLSALLGNGVPVLPAYDAAVATLSNTWLRQKLAAARGRIADGSGLSAALRATGVLPEAALSMVAIGERRGDLAAGWRQLVTVYQRDLRRLTKVMASLIEPILILLIGGVVAFIVTALLLPIFRMNMMMN